MTSLCNGILYMNDDDWAMARSFKIRWISLAMLREKASQRRMQTHDFTDINRWKQGLNCQEICEYEVQILKKGNDKKFQGNDYLGMEKGRIEANLGL